jgi:hypothetical protein
VSRFTLACISASFRRASFGAVSRVRSSTSPDSPELHEGYFVKIPMLAALVERETAEGLDLTNGVEVIVATNSFRTDTRWLLRYL